MQAKKRAKKRSHRPILTPNFDRAYNIPILYRAPIPKRPRQCRHTYTVLFLRHVSIMRGSARALQSTARFRRHGCL